MTQRRASQRRKGSQHDADQVGRRLAHGAGGERLPVRPAADPGAASARRVGAGDVPRRRERFREVDDPSIAASVGSVTIGGAPAATDPTLAPARRLADCLTVSWARKTRLGFFMRAEDFITWTRQAGELLGELDGIAGAAKADGQRDWWRAYGLAKGERAALEHNLGDDFDSRSHGESFLDLFQRRLRDGGLHLLDEPESRLSPQRQLALLAMIRDTASRG